jgi:hypothetical protein
VNVYKTGDASRARREQDKARARIRNVEITALVLFVLLAINYVGFQSIFASWPPELFRGLVGALMLYNVYLVPTLAPAPGAKYLPPEYKRMPGRTRLWFWGAIVLGLAGLVAFILMKDFWGLFVMVPLYLPAMFYVLGCKLYLGARRT